MKYLKFLMLLIYIGQLVHSEESKLLLYQVILLVMFHKIKKCKLIQTRHVLGMASIVLLLLYK